MHNNREIDGILYCRHQIIRRRRRQYAGHVFDGNRTYSYLFKLFYYAHIILLLFADALLKTKSLRIAGLSVAASFIQIFGYGLGFIRSFVDKIILKHGLEDLETLKRVYK